MAHQMKQHDRKPSIRTFLGLVATQLAAPLDASATSVAVKSGRDVTPGLYRIDNEYVTVTTVSGDVLTVTRASEGSAATAHAANAVVHEPALRAGDAVSFIMRLAPVTGSTGATSPKVNTAAVVESVPLSLVRYDWSATDTTVSGRFEAEWERRGSDGLTQTFPTDSYDEVVIYRDLDGAS